jgi:hypothetical protein
MPEREFLIYLDPEHRVCRYRHHHVSKGKKIIEFRIQLEILVDEEKIGLNGTRWKKFLRLDRKIYWKTGLSIASVSARR